MTPHNPHTVDRGDQKLRHELELEKGSSIIVDIQCQLDQSEIRV